ncbi:hypothetical protein [Staphylococcus aureus]|uniref:hypothetical protein n=1 Tax=Staphylococcus aureus TaxID=1280 RepID=UPI0027EDE1E4|nr:hypothetical protein [Staphylococcus aureus]MDQ7134577.1 hypothetical protein [Staphylococcus aureus]
MRNIKNVRIDPETHQKLKEIRFYTDESFVDITTHAIEMYYKQLKAEGKIK